MLTMKTKIGYGTGDLASNLVFQLSVIYLLYFYTDVAGITPAAVGVIFLIARIWDSVNDPIMGYIIDHTHSRHGKSRVYLRYASLPLALATFLLFLVPEIDPTAKIIYAGISYILWGMLYTMVNIPYSSMTAELTGDSVERTSLSSVRMLFMLTGVIIVSVATEPLVSAFANPQRGYFFVALIYGSLAFVFFQVCFAATKRIEIHPTAHRENYTLKQSIKIIGKNSQLLILTGAFLVGATAEYIRETSAIYYVAYNLGNSSLLPAFMGTVVLSMIIANLIIPAVTRKIDKKGTYYAGTVIAAAASLVFHFIPFDNLPLILTFAAISSFGLTVVSTLGWSMLPDTVEYGQALTGVRTEGVIYSFFSFSQKLATALAGAIVAITLQLTEYVPKQPVQGDAALTGILSTLTFIPIGLILLSALILKFYKLDKEHFDKLKTQLNAEETPPE